MALFLIEYRNYYKSGDKMIKYKYKKYDAKYEFRTIISNFLFPILGMLETDLQYISPINFEIKDNVYFYKNKLFFFPSLSSDYGYFVPVNSSYKIESFSLINQILQALINISYNNFEKKGIKNNYLGIEDVFCHYQRTIKKEVYSFLNINNLSAFDNLLLSASTLVKSNKTSGPIACVFKQHIENNAILTLMDVLNMKRSSKQRVFLINKNGGIVDHEDFSKEKIDKYLENDDIGLVFSKSGNIFLIKDNCINFISRNNNFYTFRHRDFVYSIKSNRHASKINEDVLYITYICMLKAMIYNKDKKIIIVKNEDISKINIKNLTMLDIDKIFLEHDKCIINEDGYLLDDVNKKDSELLKIITTKSGILKVYIDGVLKYQLK